MTYNWTFEDLNIYNEIGVNEPKSTVVSVEFQLICTDLGCAPSGMYGPPEFYDPGEGATWEIETIEIVFDEGKPLQVTEAQLSALFPNGNDMINNAIEAAAEHGVIS